MLLEELKYLLFCPICGKELNLDLNISIIKRKIYCNKCMIINHEARCLMYRYYLELNLNNTLNLIALCIPRENNYYRIILNFEQSKYFIDLITDLKFLTSEKVISFEEINKNDIINCMYTMLNRYLKLKSLT